MPFDQRVARWFTLICRVGTGGAFGVLLLSVTVQVVGRTIGSSPVWTEELTRFALLYLAAFGTGLALRTGDLVNVDLVAEAMPRPFAWLLRLLSAAAVLVLSLALMSAAWRFTSIGAFQTSPALGWRMTYIHASMLVLLALLGVFAALRIWGMLRGHDDGLPMGDSPEALAHEERH
ncbi:TRAP transporter small permease [Acuticoccus sp. 2012]|uniref:TRAP transporter small permease protein n=2 Tax=Acuticoccus mangrovi TaxID=2796142 RepID=A0A934MDE9_9HYPH|nr:TRAP transporter small permease [Acuticoccus mangrovi]